MAIDQPLTVYPKEKDKSSTNGGHTAAEMKRISEEWERKHGKAGKISEKISLSDFLNGKDKGNEPTSKS